MEHSASFSTGQPHHTHHIARALITTIVVAIVGYVLLTIGFAVGRWSGPVAQKIATTIPTPIGFYRGHILWQRDVLAMTSGMRSYIENIRASGDVSAVPSGDPEEIGMNTLVRTEASRTYLAEQGIDVSAEDISQAFTAQMTQSGSQNAITDRIQKIYGWTPSQYRRYVTTADILRSKMKTYILSNESISSPERKQAEAVATMISKKEVSFSEAAKKYGEDIYAAKSGDMGFIGRDELDSAIENAAFRLKPGEISSVVVSSYGYHILQVTEQRQADNGLQVHLYQIFISGPDVDQAITAELNQHRPWILVVGMRWDAETGRVQTR